METEAEDRQIQAPDLLSREREKMASAEDGSRSEPDDDEDKSSAASHSSEGVFLASSEWLQSTKGKRHKSQRKTWSPRRIQHQM